MGADRLPGLIAIITLSPRPLHMNVLGALLILVFGFLFATVSSRLTGEVGSTSNPISGMAVATLLFTCLIFLVLGWTGGQYYVTALSVGAIVCIAASNAGTTSQDLKTGFLVGATPRLQQYAILCGALCVGADPGPDPAEAERRRHRVRAGRAGGAEPGGRKTKLTETAQLQGRRPSRPRDLSRSGSKSDTANGPAGKYLVTRRRQAGLPGRPGHQRPVHQASGRHRGEEIRRAEGRADVLHHQGHPRPAAAVDAGAVRRDDRGGAGNGRHPGAGVLGGRVPAAGVDRRRSRSGGLVRWAVRPPQQQAAAT
jgi:hypothetical protein